MHKAYKLSVCFSSRIHLTFLTTQSEPVLSSPVPTQENITRLILEQKSATEALQTFRWASELRNFTHNQSTYRALIHKLCNFRRFDTAQEMLDEMPSSIGSTPDEDIFITIIRGLGRARMIKQVIKVPELVFKFEKKPTLKLYNSILDVLVKEDIDIAREFYRMKMMGSGIQGDDYTYGILMKGLCLTNRIGDGFKLLQVMKTRGITPNTVIYNTLIHALCKNGKVGRARSLMRELVEPSDVTFNILISAYCGERNLVQALVMLEKSFSKGYIPDVIMVTKVVELLCNNGRASEAVEVLQRVEERGGIVDVVAYNTLINGFCRLGNVKVGCRLLKEMELKGCLPNADTYSGLISGLCDSKMLNLALDMFNEMKRVGINWNFVTYDTLIHGLCSSGRVEDGLKILELMEDDKGASAFHISPYNGIMYGLYKENRLEEALAFLRKMENSYPRAVDRSMRILGFCENGSIDEARRVYDQMVGEGVMPSALIYANLISGFCSKGCVREALELMNEMIGHGYLPVASTFNALINLLCRQGRLGKASKLMEDIIGRGCLLDYGSYSPFIDVFCSNGDFHKAFMFFLQMVEKGIVPDYHSWNKLLLCLCQQKSWLEGNNKICRLSSQLQVIIQT
ncbi:PREDICTED: pentatricopeptide repeat-containing protein At2g17525, mitochondrial [Nicotiana attenuata]|uniref:Pentatricopeptide repeat-containing protein, mitochondrial n=1 Tax=Nicotiana attenuata TaxID=49451 RepID=A0A314L2A3_NICAT|nr:PREDICTED: pentatricopeptide repeat-containing protein At2g17525, mitochondrial [Nicotiana attenuata]OIT35768.1 pentatricopeptide repeat-containing protein, mitochondrial [Nicotiana attenuata]